MTIRTRLLASVLAATLVPTGLMIGVAYQLGQRAQYEFINTRATNVTKEVIRQLELRSQRYSDDVRQIATSPLMSGAVPALRATKGATSTTAASEARRELDEILPALATSNQYEDIILFDNKSTILYATNTDSRALIGKVPEGGLLKEVYRVAEPNDSSIFILDDIEQGETHHSIIFSYAFRSGRELQGILVLHIPVSAVQNILDSVKALGKTAESLLVINDGTNAHIISSARLVKTSNDMNVPFSGDRGYAVQHAAKAETGNGIVQSYTGSKSIASWGYLKELQVGVVTQIDYSDALSALAGMRRILLYIIIAMILVLFAAVWYVVRRYVSVPLTHLALVAQQVADGQEADHVDHDLLHHHDEIGKIADSIHSLSRAVKHGPSAAANATKENPAAIPPDHYHGK
jgi:HAMP domain-containing protein